MIPEPIKVAILSSQRQDLFPAHCPEPINLVWFDEPSGFFSQRADVYIDLDFDGSSERIQQLAVFDAAAIVVNSVSFTCAELAAGFIRLNGWPGFTHPEVLELAWRSHELPPAFLQFAEACGKSCIRVPDTVGMIRPRIVAMIINEAWMAFEENVSTPGEIDIAMKMGTNYPLGPFEWTKWIGREALLTLLQKLAKEDPAYTPANLLVQPPIES